MGNKIIFYDKNNRSRFLKCGDLICGYSNFPNDIYKSQNYQVKNGIEKVGSPKKRFGLILEIIDHNTIIVSWSTSKSTKQKYHLTENNTNRIYKFSDRLISIINPQRDILFKNLLNCNLEDKEQIIKNLKQTQTFFYCQNFSNKVYKSLKK